MGERESLIQQKFKRHRCDLLIVLLLLLLPFVVNFNIFFSFKGFPKIFPYRNDFVHSYNQLALTVSILRNHQSCLWYPCRGFGMPYLGFPVSCMLYPPAIILSFFAGPQGSLSLSQFAVYLFLAKAFAAISLFLVMKNMGINRWGSSVGAIVWAANLRFDDVMRGEPGSAHTLIWLPLLFLLTVKLLTGAKKKHIAYFALILALVFFANYSVNYIMYLAFIGLFLVLFPFDSPGGFNKQRYMFGVMILGAAVALGVCLVSVQLLPNLEYIRHWVRGRNYSFADTMIYRCKPWEYLFGYIFPEAALTERDHYFGILPLLLSVFGLTLPDSRYKFKKIFLAVILLTSIYAMNFPLSTPLQKFLYDYVPFFDQLRCPGRFLILSMFCFSLLTAYGMDAVTTSSVSHKGTRGLAAASIGFLLLITAAGYLAPEGIALLHKKVFFYDTLLFVLISSLVLILLIAAKKEYKHIYYFLVIAVILCDLLYVTHRKDDPYDDSHINYYLKKDPKISGADSLLRKAIDEKFIVLPSIGHERVGLQYWQQNYPFLFFNSFIPALSHPNKFGYQWGLSDTNYFFVKTIDNRKARSVFNTRFDVQYFLPRAFIVYQLEKLPREEILKKMTSSDFDPLNRHYIEEDAPPKFTELLTVPQNPSPDESTRLRQIKTQAQILEYSNSSIRIQADIPKPGFLFLSDAFFPGWKAYVDGEPSTIFRTNYLFRGVFTPAGKHIVSFRYRPLPVVIGMILSLIAFAVLLSLLVLDHNKLAALLIGGFFTVVYVPLALPNLRVEARPKAETVNPYNVDTIENRPVEVQQNASHSIDWEMEVEQQGVYDLLIQFPPQAYSLHVDNKFAAHVYNIGEDGPLPEPGVWEVQAVLSLEPGWHSFRMTPVNCGRRNPELFLFHTAYREKSLNLTRDINEELHRRYRIKLVKH